MKKIFLSFLIATGTFFTAVAQKEIINDPNAEVRTLSGSFTSIKISGGIDLFLSQSETASIAVSASEPKFRDAIKAEVVNGVLKIYYDENNWNSMKNWKNKKLRAYVSFKNLEGLQASGACDVQVAGVITVPELLLNCSGASDFKGAVKVTDLKMELSGASDVKISGTATTVNISSSGASDVKGFDLAADFCTAKASGASDINITVNKELTASASGASDISYKGDAVIKESHSGGASSVSKKG
jgi:Putative auto-transporter adhesin, head GIN domain